MRPFPAQLASAFAVAASVAVAETIITLDTALSNCPPLGAVLPAPRHPSSNPTVQAIVSELSGLGSAAAALLGNATGMSVVIASLYEDTPLLSLAYTPPVRNTSGTSAVDGDTVFRIASVSKVFTVLGLLLLGDQVRMGDPVTQYIPELAGLKAQQEVHTAVTTVDWDEITLDALASQLAGIPNTLEYDLAGSPALDAAEFGLPTLTANEYVDCGAVSTSRPCTWDDFWANFGKRLPSYGPYHTPAYSNIAYDLLGLVIERVSNQGYEDYIQQKILTPLNMTQTYLAKPDNDSLGFISSDADNWWSTDLGLFLADGGYYSSSNDLIKLGRGILGHQLLSATATRAWLKPRTHTASLGLSVGAPWEIGRANNLTVDGRVIDIYSKTGGIGDYNTLFAVLPDYGLVMSFLTAGNTSTATLQFEVASLILPSLVRGLEAAGKAETQDLYAGTYANDCTNSSITVAVDDQAGLNVTNWIMNGKDVLAAYAGLTAFGVPDTSPYLAVRLLPAGLESGNQSAWRAVFATTPPADVDEADQLFVLQLDCQSWTVVDNIMYGLRGLDAFVFGLDGASQNATSLSPSMFRQTLGRVG